MIPAIISLIAVAAALFIFALIMGGTNIRFHITPKEGRTCIACVGDSTTCGTVVFYNCYPAQLGRMLGNEYHVANFGFNGKTALDVNDNSFRRTNQELLYKG